MGSGTPGFALREPPMACDLGPFPAVERTVRGSRPQDAPHTNRIVQSPGACPALGACAPPLTHHMASLASVSLSVEWGEGRVDDVSQPQLVRKSYACSSHFLVLLCFSPQLLPRPPRERHEHLCPSPDQKGSHGQVCLALAISHQAEGGRGPWRT